MREKKSEVLEVRLSHPQKRAFMEACEEEQVTASEKTRHFIADFLADRERRKTLAKEAIMTIRTNPIKTVAGIAALAVSSVLLTSEPSMAESPAFKAWDANGDGYIAPDELSCAPTPNPYTDSDRLSFKSGCRTVISAMDINNDGAINADEFTPVGRVIIKEDKVLLVNGERKRQLRAAVVEWDISKTHHMQSGVSADDRIVPLDSDDNTVREIFIDLLRNAEQTAAGATYPSEELNRL